MVASPDRPATAGAGRRLRWWIWPLLLVPAGFAATCWWLTEPLEDGPGLSTATAASGPPVALSPRELVEAESPLTWPETRLEGTAAKELLLRTLVRAAERLNAVESYTATFHKQERMRGKLGPVQTLAMKVRHRPFAVYFKFLAPSEGREVVFAEGRHENKVIAHGGGVARLLVPRLAVPPDHPLALVDSRHAVTEAGLANLTARLIHFREEDLRDPEAETVLDRVADTQGRPRLRSVHFHPTFHEGRPFAKVEVLYDPATFFPVEIWSFDWPEPGQGSELRLAEHYRYEDLDLDVPLTALDFDPANPNYAFHRY